MQMIVRLRRPMRARISTMVSVEESAPARGKK